jgi:hypothetical protein
MHDLRHLLYIALIQMHKVLLWTFAKIYPTYFPVWHYKAVKRFALISCVLGCLLEAVWRFKHVKDKCGSHTTYTQWKKILLIWCKYTMPMSTINSSTIISVFILLMKLCQYILVKIKTIRVPPHAWRNCSIHLLIAIQSGLSKVIICYKFWGASPYNCCLVPKITAKLKIGGFWLWYQVPIHYLLLYCISIGYWIIMLSLLHLGFPWHGLFCLVQHPIPEACFSKFELLKFPSHVVEYMGWNREDIIHLYNLYHYCMVHDREKILTSGDHRIGNIPPVPSYQAGHACGNVF